MSTFTTETIDPQERIEDAEYDLGLARRAASGRSLEEIEGDMEVVRARERGAMARGEYEKCKAAMLARFALMKEQTKALAVKACEAELEEAKRAKARGEVR